MVGYDSLEERKLPIACGDTPLKRISCTKLLGVHVDQHLTWKTHVDHVLISSSDGTLSVLRRLKHLALFHVRKHLAESLVLSKVDCKTVGFFLKISKEIGNAWRKSLMRANRASLTRP